MRRVSWTRTRDRRISEKCDRQIIDCIEAQIFEGFERSQFPGSAHPGNDDEILRRLRLKGGQDDYLVLVYGWAITLIGLEPV